MAELKESSKFTKVAIFIALGFGYFGFALAIEEGIFKTIFLLSAIVIIFGLIIYSFYNAVFNRK